MPGKKPRRRMTDQSKILDAPPAGIVKFRLMWLKLLPNLKKTKIPEQFVEVFKSPHLSPYERNLAMVKVLKKAETMTMNVLEMETVARALLVFEQEAKYLRKLAKKGKLKHGMTQEDLELLKKQVKTARRKP